MLAVTAINVCKAQRNTLLWLDTRIRTDTEIIWIRSEKLIIMQCQGKELMSIDSCNVLKFKNDSIVIRFLIEFLEQKNIKY